MSNLRKTIGPRMVGSLTATEVSGSAVMTWSAAEDAVGTVTYTVTRSPAFSGTVTTTSTTYTDTTASGNPVYTVTATDSRGLTSGNSVSAGVTIPGAATTYPRLGMYWIGQGDLGSFTTMYQSAQGIENMRRRHVVVMNAWPELQTARGVSTNDIVASVKAASTIGTKVYLYTDTERVYKSSYTSAYATRQAKIAAENWYVYASGSSGTPIDSYFAANGYWINPTDFVTPDSAGRNAMEWLADYEPTWMWEGAEGNEASTLIDGIFWDNALLRPRKTGDLNRDGSGDTPSNSTVSAWYRAGIASGVTRLRTTYPAKQSLGNLAEFPNAPGWLGSFAALTSYTDLFDGGVLEHIIGRSFSPESFMTTAEFVAAVQGSEDALLDPSLGIFNACPDDFVQTNYQAMRHSLAACLVICDMAFGWTRNTEGQSDWDWYDEYDFNLGAPTQTRRTTSVSGGIWRRDYENGIAIWWPKGVAGTLTLGGTFYALQGNARGWLTAGQAVTSVTAPSARNGLILSRTPT